MAKPKKLNLSYPEYSARRYALVVKNNPHNLPVLDPATFFLARAYLMHRDALAKTIKNVHSEIKKDKSHPYHFLAEEYTPEQLASEIEKGVNRKHSTKKLWRNSGIEAVRNASATRHVLSGKVMPYGPKRDPHEVHIDEFLASAREEPGLAPGSLFTSARSTSSDAGYTAEKPSFDSFRRLNERRYELIDVPTAALLLFAEARPKSVESLDEVFEREDGLRIWVPFRTANAGPSKFTPKENADHILVETLFDYYARGRTKKEKSAKREKMNQFDIAKRLFSIDIIYDDRAIRLLQTGNAAFQAIQDEMIMESNSDVEDAIKEWYWGKAGGGIRAFLKQHYKPEGLVLVKKNSKNEAVAESYKSIRGDDHLRIVYGNHPPLVMRLWPVEGNESNVQVLYEESRKRKAPESSTAHPYSELFQIKKVYDDSSRRVMWATYQLPQQADIPDKMFEDMITTAEQNGTGRQEIIKRMVVHDQRLRGSGRGYMCSNSQMTRRVMGRF